MGRGRRIWESIDLWPCPLESERRFIDFGVLLLIEIVNSVRIIIISIHKLLLIRDGTEYKQTRTRRTSGMASRLSKKDVIDRHRRRWWLEATAAAAAKKYLIVSLAVRNNNFSMCFFRCCWSYCHAIPDLSLYFPHLSLSPSLHVLFIAHYMNKLFLFFSPSLSLAPCLWFLCFLSKEPSTEYFILEVSLNTTNIDS